MAVSVLEHITKWRRTDAMVYERYLYSYLVIR